MKFARIVAVAGVVICLLLTAFSVLGFVLTPQEGADYSPASIQIALKAVPVLVLTTLIFLIAYRIIKRDDSE